MFVKSTLDCKRCKKSIYNIENSSCCSISITERNIPNLLVTIEMSFPYVVIQFLKEGTYSEIPTLWLTKDFTRCRWPPTKNVNFFIKKNYPPEVDWSYFDVRVECHCETLEKARTIAENANYSISCDEIRGRGKRIIYKKKFDDIYDICDDSEDDDDDSSSQNQIPQKKLKIHKSQDSSEKKSLCDKNILLKEQSSFEKVAQIAAEKNFSAPNSSLCAKLQTQIIVPQVDKLNESLAHESKKINGQNLNSISTASPLSMDGDVEKLISICIQTLNYVKSIDQRLRALEKNVVNIEQPTDIFSDILPINSIENLQKFEETLDDIETKTNFIQFLKNIEGKGSKNLVHRCMSRLFTNEFGKACSWRGRGSNYRMCDLKCINILKYVLKAKDLSECEFENIASEWFRFSKMRYDREIKKTLPDDSNTHEKFIKVLLDSYLLHP
ncbi:uncharacterized protein LOC105198146 isoform X2 [Solenopsis invicta]|uniref:uncharacterized protein LOC105198146 isoform X2 n=1 Tax=Solenopsis invicta TaxID=13686 RepID=UPI00193DE9AE|nr:uncharacterized protein LOC105198146 isoform X2 [Solenopsis invicta]